MKFIITTFTNVKDKVLIKNDNDTMYCYKNIIELKPKEEKELNANMAKILFGDWTDETHAEQRRRVEKNIHHYVVEIRSKTAEISTLQSNDEQTVVKKAKEPEFKMLDEVEEEKVVEKQKCAATTKSGAPCKSTAVEGSEYCNFHKKK
jgi:hypothetical protein